MPASYAETLAALGASLDGARRPMHYGDPAAELEAARRACAVAERSDFARLRATGKDILDLLHRLSTQDLKGLEPGTGAPTILTTPKGRIIERLFVHHLGGNGVLLVGGPGSAERIVAHLRKYTFAEDTGLADIASETAQIALVGPSARVAAQDAGLPVPEAWGSGAVDVGGGRVHVLGHDGYGLEGVSLIGSPAALAATLPAVFEAVRGRGGRPAGDLALEAWRVLSGFPASGRELTDDRNPLEAGQRVAVSFTKGCYVGQEVVARLNTYDKVSRRLVGLELSPGAEPPEPGDVVLDGEREIGTLTSVVVPPGWDHPVALAFVKSRGIPEGRSEVTLAGASGRVTARLVDLPFPADA